MGLSLASRPFYQLSGPGGSAPRSPLSCPQLRALSSPGLRGAFARLASSARPRAAARGRRGRRRGGGGLCPPPPPPFQPAAGAGGRNAAHRQPRGARDGGGTRRGCPHGLEPTALFKRVTGLCFPPASRELQSGPRCSDRLAPLWDLAAPARPPGGHDPSAVRGASPGSPAARHRRRALDRYDGRSFSSAGEGGSRRRSAGGHAGGVEGAASTLTFHWAEWEAPVGLRGRGLGCSVGT